MEQTRADEQIDVTAAKPTLPAPGKKPYEAPQILYRAPLEAMATVCQPPSEGGVGKAFPGVGGCSEGMS